MKFQLLNPLPDHYEIFRLDRQSFVPEFVGCYTLVSFQGVVLYVGLTENLRRRFCEHLGDSKKTKLTKNGRAFFFYWLHCDTLNKEKLERTWLNQCLIVDGALPILNKVSSPI